jgi:hypothetical protein
MSNTVWMSPPDHPRQRFLIEKRFMFKMKAEGWVIAKR